MESSTSVQQNTNILETHWIDAHTWEKGEKLRMCWWGRNGIPSPPYRMQEAFDEKLLRCAQALESCHPKGHPREEGGLGRSHMPFSWRSSVCPPIFFLSGKTSCLVAQTQKDRLVGRRSDMYRSLRVLGKGSHSLAGRLSYLSFSEALTVNDMYRSRLRSPISLVAWRSQLRFWEAHHSVLRSSWVGFLICFPSFFLAGFSIFSLGFVLFGFVFLVFII